MSIALKYIVGFLFVSISFSLAKPPPSSRESNGLRAKIDEMAEKDRNIQIEDWFSFVEAIDARCESEKNPGTKESLCFLFYEVDQFAELFKKDRIRKEKKQYGSNELRGLLFDDCSRAKKTLEDSGRNQKTSASIKSILEKLCPAQP